MTKTICLIAILILALILILNSIKLWRPNGMLHIDEYLDKDVYRMLYFTPLPELKKHHWLTLKVEVQKWDTTSDDYEGVPNEKRHT